MKRAVEVALVLAVLAIVAALAAFSVFAVYRPYDDDGYVLISLVHFARGKPLYDEVYSQYGPFFNVAATSVAPALDHTFARVWTAVLWSGGAALAGVIAWREGRALPAVLAIGLVALHLRWLRNEPIHPASLTAFLGLAIVAAPRPWLAGAAAGALLATKLNLGVYALLGVGVAWAPRKLQPLAFAASAFPFVLARVHLGTEWGFTFAALVAGSAFLVARASRSSMAKAPDEPVFDVATFAASAALVFVASSAVLLARGTSLRGLADGVLLQHLGFASQFHRPAPVSFSHLATLGAAAMLQRRLERSSERAAAISKGIFGLVTVVLVLTGDAPRLLGFGVPFVALAILPPRPEEVRGRTLLAASASFAALTAYPVAETQVCLGSVLIVVAGLVCLDDAVAFLLPERRAPKLIALGVAMIAPLVSLDEARTRWTNLVPLELPGTRGVRVTQGDAVTYRWLVENLSELSDTFISLPGMNSLHLWSGREPATSWNAGAWPMLFDDAQQARIVRALEAHPRACAVRNATTLAVWGEGGAVRGPLVAYFSGFEPIASFRGFELLVKKGRAARASGVRWKEVPKLSGRVVRLSEQGWPISVEEAASCTRLEGDALLLQENRAPQPLLKE